MTNLNWNAAEYEWVERVRQLLLELARACLGDIPKLPMHVAQQARPTAERAAHLLEEARDRGLAESDWQRVPELRWTDDARKLFFELAQMYLSDRPKLPENTSSRALELSERAQHLLERPTQDELTDEPSSAPTTAATTETSSPPASETPHPGILLDRLKDALHEQRARSRNTNAPEWQQLFSLIDLAQGLYQRLKE